MNVIEARRRHERDPEGSHRGVDGPHRPLGSRKHILCARIRVRIDRDPYRVDSREVASLGATGENCPAVCVG